MWAKLDDALLDHQKLMEAGKTFGRDGRAKALGLYAAGLLYANKHLTDGFLSNAVIQGLNVVDQPKIAARVMSAVGFWKKVRGGYQIHDYHDHNPKAADVQAKRKEDRDRKRKGGRNHSGNGRA